MTYRYLEHTADVGVELEADSYENLLSEGVLAFTDCLTEIDAIQVQLERQVDLTAASREALLVDWLNELVYLFEAESILFRRAELEVREMESGLALSGRLQGERYDPSRHPIKTLIKAVTYHQLAVRSSNRGWTARVIFDL